MESALCHEVFGEVLSCTTVSSDKQVFVPFPQPIQHNLYLLTFAFLSLWHQFLEIHCMHFKVYVAEAQSKLRATQEPHE